MREKMLPTTEKNVLVVRGREKRDARREEEEDAPNRIGKKFSSLSPIGFAVDVFVQIHTEC